MSLPIVQIGNQVFTITETTQDKRPGVILQRRGGGTRVFFGNNGDIEILDKPAKAVKKFQIGPQVYQLSEGVQMYGQVGTKLERLDGEKLTGAWIFIGLDTGQVFRDGQPATPSTLSWLNGERVGSKLKAKAALTPGVLLPQPAPEQQPNTAPANNSRGARVYSTVSQ